MAAKKNDKTKKTPKGKAAKKGDATPAKGARKTPPPASVPPPPSDAAAHASEAMSGAEVCEALKYVLGACPKADGPDGNPAMAFVLVDGDKLFATDDYGHHEAFLTQSVSVGPLKITRGSMRSLQKKLDGELKGGAEDSTPVTVLWTGLIVEIHGVGETHHVTLKTFEGGPEAKHLRLTASALNGGVRVPLDIFRRVKWKGDGSVLVYTDPQTGRVCLDAMAGGTTVYRATLAQVGGDLGIRQPSLPGVNVPPRPPVVPPTTAPTDVPSEQDPLGLVQGDEWVRIEIPVGAAWEAVAPNIKHNVLPPGEVDAARGVVVFGPYPRHLTVVATTLHTLRRLGLDPKEVVCEACVWRLEAPPRGALPAGDGVVDAEFEDAPATPVEIRTDHDGAITFRIAGARWGALSAELRAWIETELPGGSFDETADELVLTAYPAEAAHDALLAELDAAGAVERWWATTAALDGHELASTWYDAGDAWRGTVLTAPVHAEVVKDFAGMGVHRASTLETLRATPQACAVPGLWTVAQKLKGGWANDGRSYAKKSDAAQRARELLALHGPKSVALLSDKGAVVPVPQPTREAE